MELINEQLQQLSNENLTSEQRRIRELNRENKHPALKMQLAKQGNTVFQCLVNEDNEHEKVNDVCLCLNTSYGLLNVSLSKDEALALAENLKELAK